MPPWSPRARKRVKALLLCAASLAAGLLLLEGVLRFLLFTVLARDLGLGWQLRNEALYTAREAGRETWQLRARLNLQPTAKRALDFDARFGWLSTGIDPVTFGIADETLVRGRRPVLLFGDSYVQCVPGSGPCWQELLEESPLSARYRLLNYGVGGYGLDQVYLLMEPVLERHRDQDPIVLVGILVDDDLDRCYLALRSVPKPYFTLEGTELVLHPTEHETTESYLRAHPMGIRSYLWRWFLFGSGLVSRRTALSWTDEADHVAVKQALSRRLLEEIQRTLEARGLSYFFVLFHARRALDAPGPYAWQEPLLYRTFEELHIPFVSSKRYLRAHMAAAGTRPESFYIQDGPDVNHYTPEANAVVLEALGDGLDGRFEPYAYLPER